MSSIRLSLAIAVHLIVTAVFPAHAEPLLAGEVITTVGTTAVASPQLDGTIIFDQPTSPYNVLDSTSSLFGAGHIYQNRVVESATTHTLIFAPRLTTPWNISPHDIVIDRMILHGFGTFTTDIAFRTDGPGDRGPTLAERSLDGDTIGFLFGFPLMLSNLFTEHSDESLFFSILTNATAYTNTGVATFYGRSLGYPGETLTGRIEGIAVPVASPIAVSSPDAIFLMLGTLSMLWVFFSRKNQHGHSQRQSR